MKEFRSFAIRSDYIGRKMHMRMYDIIDKKKRGQELTEQEIQYVIEGYVKEEIPDYQVAAWLMAIFFHGLSDHELVKMTEYMAKSGDMVDLSKIQGIKVDKHSTGGVGDKTTLVIAPIVAACGGKVAKMSGRGLGFTGGTIDKLESIPGFRTAIDDKEFYDIVNRTGLAVIGQSGEIAPADKKLYALRDVTATVDSIPLIATSIMSKKLAVGSDKILLDVTVGSGAFMKSKKDAIILAQKMVAIGEGAGRETKAILTNMDVPLGIAVGNEIEVVEAIQTLQGKGPKDFQEICEVFAANMLMLAKIANEKEAHERVKEVIANGSALQKFAEMVKTQGGDSEYIYHADKFEPAKYHQDFIAPQDGWVVKMDTEICGKTAVVLGAGRETKDSAIDPKAGIYFYKKTGDKVKAGETVATLCASDKEKLKGGVEYLKNGYFFGDQQVDPMKNIIAEVTKDSVIDN